MPDSVVIMPDDLDKDSATPLYEQLAALLRAQIEAGEIRSRLPSETDLCQRYDISRATAGRALDILVAEGLVKVSKGRGRFVIPPEERGKS